MAHGVQVWDADAHLMASEIAAMAGVHGRALAQELNPGFRTSALDPAPTGSIW